MKRADATYGSRVARGRICHEFRDDRGSREMSAATTEYSAPRLKTRYRDEIVPELSKQFSFGNPMQVPGLVKIVVNMGVGQAAKDSKLMDGAVRDLTLITGQKPLVQRARKSIAQFKLREGMPI